MSPITGTFSLLSPGDLLPQLLPNAALGDTAVNLDLASGTVATPFHLPGAAPVEFTFHAGGGFTVTALNGKNGADASGVVGKSTSTPAGTFTPLLTFDRTNGWLKYAASATVKVDADAAAAPVSFTGGAGASVVSADYRRHGLGQGVLSAVTADIGGMRSALVPDHVRQLPDGDALAFETHGDLTCALEIAWADVFTSEIGALTRLIHSVAPVAIRLQAGATCSVQVSVSDAFVVAFARPVAGGALRVAVKKGRSRDVDATAGVSVRAAVASPKSIEQVLGEAVAGVLGTSADRLASLLSNAGDAGPVPGDVALSNAIAERLGLAGVGALRDAVAALEAQVGASLKSLVESKVEAAFAYEYHRVSSDVVLFEAEVPEGGPAPDLHRQLVTGDLAAAFNRPPTEIAVTRFLNEHTTTATHAWGFTLGFGKWKLFGQDRRALQEVTRRDAAGRLMRSYIGSGGYARTKLEWAADFAADMTAYSPRPLVADYRLGLHLAWTRSDQTFTDGDLETALDFAALWSICPETSLPWLRQQLAEALNRKAEWSFHVRVNDEALRPMLRVLGSMTPRDLAGAAAGALDPDLVPSVSERRRVYAPLWGAVLASPEAFTLDHAARSAESLLERPDLAHRERLAAENRVYDANTVAGIMAFDTDWLDAAGRFQRGCRLLADAIATGAPDVESVPAAYRQLVRFWTQSHYVRTLGAALVDVALQVDQAKGVERTLNLSWGATRPKSTLVVSSNKF